MDIRQVQERGLSKSKMFNIWLYYRIVEKFGELTLFEHLAKESLVN